MIKTLSIYIHIPFCKTICTFCNFLTFAHKTKWIPDYIDALIIEIKQKSLNYKNQPIQTIYFGGGTPSLIDSIYIEKVVTAIHQNFLVIENPEISLEANPESLTLEKIHHYQQIGLTRLSLGIQSLNAKTLRKVARPHDEKAVLIALENLKKTNWKNFGCDLIMGLPYQTKEEFSEHLEKILEFSPTHLSSYFLSYDTKKIDLFIKDCPEEEEQIAMYNLLINKLGKAGFNHYEVSNYALPGFECQHNLRYWNRKEYLGLGIGAHSFIQETVSENIRDFDKYLETPLLLEDSYQLDYETQCLDYIMLKLRQKSGIDFEEFTNHFGLAKTEELKQNAQKYSLGNFLKISKNSIKPTEQGFLIIDKITRDLL